VGDESGWGWAADLGSYPAAWVLAVALIGRAAPSVPAAAVRAAVFFLAMTVAYYSWAQWVLGFGWSRATPAWLLLSVTAVPAVAGAVQWATRRAGPVAGALLALAAGITVTSGVLHRQWLVWSGDLPVEFGHPVQAAADLAVALALVLLLPRHRRTRIGAVVLALPMAWLADLLLGLLRRLLHLG
jgi:hypothetical protein